MAGPSDEELKAMARGRPASEYRFPRPRRLHPLESVRRALEGKIEPLAMDSLERALDHVPSGRRLLVVRQAPPKESDKGIQYPEAYLKRVGAGWVLAAGQDIGTSLNLRFPGGWYGTQEEILGMKVTFGRGTFQGLVTHERESHMDTNYGVITDCDVITYSQGERLSLVAGGE